MRVYAAKDANKPVFKIGKANVVLSRLSRIGALKDFDLAASHCIRLPSEQDALRVEDAIHKLFHPWNIKPDRANRRDGDTEIYSIECYDLLLKFWRDYPDLVFGAVPETIPVPQISAGTKSPEELRLARAKREQKLRKEEANEFRLAMCVLECAINQLEELNLEVFQLCDGPEPFVIVETESSHLFVRAHGLLCILKIRQFFVDKARNRESSVLTEPKCERDTKTGRWRVSATVATPITDGNRDSLVKEYVRLVEMFPRSEVQREPVLVHNRALPFY